MAKIRKIPGIKRIRPIKPIDKSKTFCRLEKLAKRRGFAAIGASTKNRGSTIGLRRIGARPECDFSGSAPQLMTERNADRLMPLGPPLVVFGESAVPKFKVAHLREQGQNMLIFPLIRASITNRIPTNLKS